VPEQIEPSIPAEETTPASEGPQKKPKKKVMSRLEHLAVVVNLEFLLAWIQISNIPPIPKMKIKKAILALYRYMFPLKRSSERRPKDKEAPKNAEKPKSKHSGRRGAEDFPNAPREKHHVEGVKLGDSCLCGGVFANQTFLESLQFVAVQPIYAVVKQRECLRCNSCDAVCQAQLPEHEAKRHHPTAISMVALMKYGSGFPFYRMETFLGHFGLALRASTQFEMVAAGIPVFEPIYDELQKQGALAGLLQSDDTSAKITKFERPEEFANRTGIFTTGLLAILGTYKIGIFKTGAKHTGEHVAAALKTRPEGQASPIFMADGLRRNFPKAVEEATKVANCLSHGRRYFVDLVHAFPDQCQDVLDALGTVFFNDSLAKANQMSPEDRMFFHQVFSQSIMDDLKLRMQRQLDDHLVEANSRLGKAYRYMIVRWERLTLFLREPGAPLDNNAVERMLKKAVLNRKNAYFYRTNRGAKVGDIYMSLIYTCELNGVNAFEYLTELQNHAEKVKAKPAEWVPWNFRDTLNHLLGIRDEHAPRPQPRGSPIDLLAA
jgi:transposase